MEANGPRYNGNSTEEHRNQKNNVGETTFRLTMESTQSGKIEQETRTEIMTLIKKHGRRADNREHKSGTRASSPTALISDAPGNAANIIGNAANITEDPVDSNDASESE